MGGSVSSGVDNDDLVDRLANAGYIRSREVERIFRAVDRGHYYTETPPVVAEDRDGGTHEADAERRKAAYRDIAWKFGLLHLSAPCVYCEVVEYLKLCPGQSFLNLGSGTGYLSTIVGLILGPHGINHGVEIHEEVVRYANWKLSEFKQNSDALYEFELCEPKFTIGNCLCLDSGVMQYDRVYCGAACPEAYENYMKNLLKVGGILVMPLNHQLIQITRLSETRWETVSVLPVSFAPLILPSQNNSQSSKDSNQTIKLPTLEPLGLQDSCRHLIRTLIRKKMEREHPILRKRSYVRRMRQKTQKNSEELKNERRHGDQSRRPEDGRIHSLKDNNDGYLRSLGLVVFRELEGMRNMDQVLTLIHVNRRLLGRETQRSAQGILRRSFLRTAFRMEEERTTFGEGENVWVNELDDFRLSSSSSASSSPSTSSSSTTSSSDSDDDDDGLELFLADGANQKDSPSRNATRHRSSSEANTSSRDEDEICESKVKRLRLQNNERSSGRLDSDASVPGSSKSSRKKIRFKVPPNIKLARRVKSVQEKDEQIPNPSNPSKVSSTNAEGGNASSLEEPNVEKCETQPEASCSEKEEAMSCDSHPLDNAHDIVSDDESTKDTNSSDSEENFCFNCENKLGGCGEDKWKKAEEVSLPSDDVCDENGDLDKEDGLEDIDDDKDPKDGVTYPKLMCARIQSLPLPPLLKLYLNYQRPL
ncbi:uncharacterized protein LOC124153416 [Ischnura elegans]|uniref:uncharacterized protein LOC124153416 n=1 Tax=Ischnura elegans TaxID=197161 RepID=UPI001ED89239|nr:uncharacterized protein LOC124153416 [Ischnura elegans]